MKKLIFALLFSVVTGFGLFAATNQNPMSDSELEAVLGGDAGSHCVTCDGPITINLLTLEATCESGQLEITEGPCPESEN